jgi:hypothetical protein
LAVGFIGFAALVPLRFAVRAIAVRRGSGWGDIYETYPHYRMKIGRN